MNESPVATLVLIPVASTLTGYTEKAIRRKIQEGVWLEGYEYHRAPDGHIIIDLGGYATWVRGERQLRNARA